MALAQSAGPAMEGSEAAAPTPPHPVIRFGVSLVAAATTVVLLFTIGGFFARWHWRLEQVCHFRVQYVWLLVAAGAVLFVARRPKLAAVAMVGGLVNAALIVPIYLPAGGTRVTKHAAAPLKVISFNVLSSNPRKAGVVEWLRSESADVVLLMEIHPAWINSLELLRDMYPHQKVVARRDNFGIALLSKTPWSKVSVQTFSPAELPSLHATLQHAGRPLTFLGTHPLPPGTSQMAADRNEQLRQVGAFVRGIASDGSGQPARPLVLAGDLNLTEHSPYFRDLLRASGLADTRQGIGIQASWSPKFPFLSLPLDHILASRELAVSSRRLGPQLGSDHRPVVVQLAWRD
jgi:endonuclease/exonuclease/phosphatase (EEP) superfamily protein YafD